jgi:lysozyme
MYVIIKIHMKKKTKELLKVYIKNNEGIESEVYRDSLDIPTIGIGYNLTQKSARTDLLTVGVDLNQISEKEVKLTQLQIDDLFEISLKRCEKNIKKIIPDFEALSSVRQIVLLDMLFNLGPTRLSNFTRLLKAIEAGDWVQAGKEILNSKYATQVPKRAKKNAVAIEKNVLPQSSGRPSKRGTTAKHEREAGRGENHHDFDHHKPDRHDKPDRHNRPDKPVRGGDDGFRGPGPLT